MILLIDNYDSFVHNLARHFARLGQETHVVRNDAIDVAAVRAMAPHAVVLSPGPCTPAEAGCSLDLVRQVSGEVPILGVCLGHQTIGAAFGGRIVRAATPMHGRSSLITHERDALFAGMPSPLRVGRYHSLIVDRNTLPGELCITAQSDDGIVMGLAHRQHPTFGVQFHPESILTDRGYELLGNFLRLAGINATGAPRSEDERPGPLEPQRPIPHLPVTF